MENELFLFSVFLFCFSFPFTDTAAVYPQVLPGCVDDVLGGLVLAGVFSWTAL